MANLILPPGWQGRERDVTDYTAYQNRRQFIKRLGLGSIGVATMAGTIGCTPHKQANMSSAMPAAPPPSGPLDTIPKNAPRAGFPAAANTAYTVPEREVTQRLAASSYNNFYEFKHMGDLKNLWHLTGDFKPYPWTLEVTGLVEKKLTLDLADLIRTIGLEERIYRFRCVEAWSTTVPWTGFPLRKLVERCKPLSKATHLRFLSANRPDEMPGIKSGPWYKWPYYEGLRMDEAMNDLAFVAVGMYGEPLPKQNGSPIRLALPWKYGYKGPKSVERIEFVDKEPPTFWNDFAPTEYSFLSNVNPYVPHPRWSQANERFLVSLEEERRIPTQLFNGYTEWVGDLYPNEPRG